MEGEGKYSGACASGVNYHSVDALVQPEGEGDTVQSAGGMRG